jgi:hypothetical protein
MKIHTTYFISGFIFAVLSIINLIAYICRNELTFLICSILYMVGSSLWFIFGYKIKKQNVQLIMLSCTHLKLSI